MDAPVIEKLRKSPSKKPLVKIDENKDLSFCFRLKRYAKPKNPYFKGLWELCVIDEEGKVLEVVSDADGLYYCLENVHGILENMGL